LFPRWDEVKAWIICTWIVDGDLEDKGPGELKREERIDVQDEDGAVSRWFARESARDFVWSLPAGSTSRRAQVAKEF